jgi:hypothetical protein
MHNVRKLIFSNHFWDNAFIYPVQH